MTHVQPEDEPGARGGRRQHEPRNAFTLTATEGVDDEVRDDGDEPGEHEPARVDDVSSIPGFSCVENRKRDTADSGARCVTGDSQHEGGVRRCAGGNVRARRQQTERGKHECERARCDGVVLRRPMHRIDDGADRADESCDGRERVLRPAGRHRQRPIRRDERECRGKEPARVKRERARVVGVTGIDHGSGDSDQDRRSDRDDRV